KNTRPRSSSPFSSTVRALGCPPLPTVATIIAFGSGRPDSVASRIHRRNCSSQVGARSAIASPARAYSRRIAARSARSLSGTDSFNRVLVLTPDRCHQAHTPLTGRHRHSGEDGWCPRRTRRQDGPDQIIEVPEGTVLNVRRAKDVRF